MNALRAKLGLKPLQMNPEPAKERPQQQQDKENPPAAKIEQPNEVEEKIAMIKEKRKRLEKQKNLGDSDEEDDAMSWITKSRRQQELKKQEEAAQKLLKDLDSSSDSEDSDDPEALKRERAKRRAQAKAKKAGAMARVKHEQPGDDEDPEFVLGHDLKDLGEFARDGYLTLADKPILRSFKSDQYEIDDEEDEVEHVKIREKEKQRHNADLKSGKGKYDVFEDKQDEILAKYDDDYEAPKRTRLLVKSGVVQTSEDKAEEIRKKIEQSARDLSMVSGAKQLTEGADFYTKDELAQFRKKSRADKPQKKKRRAATTLADELIALPHESQSKEADLGSSTLRREKQKESNLKEILTGLEKRQQYEDAIGRSNEEAMWVFQNTTPVEDDDEDLYQSLAKARARTVKVKSEKNVVDSVESDRTTDMEVIGSSQRKSGGAAVKSGGGLVLDSSTEFTRAVPTAAQTYAEEDDSISALLKKRALQKKKAGESVERSIDLVKTDSSTAARGSGNVAFGGGLMAVDDDEGMDVEPEKNLASDSVSNMLVGDALPVANVGLASTLDYLRRGAVQEVKKNITVRTRASDKDVGYDNTDDIIIEQRDERGRMLSTKQSFREQSYIFHGKAPGKKKIARQLRREHDEEERRKMMDDSHLHERLDTLKKTQEESNLPYLTIEGNTSKILEQRSHIAENVREKQLEKSMKK